MNEASTSFTHDADGRPRYGCIMASALDFGGHTWVDSEIDMRELPADYEGSMISARG